MVELEGTFQAPQVPIPCNEQGHPQLHRSLGAPSPSPSSACLEQQVPQSPQLADPAPQVLPSTFSRACPVRPKLCSWHRASAAHCIYRNCLVPTLLISVQLNPTNCHHETEHVKALAIEKCCTAMDVIPKGSQTVLPLLAFS
uniref:Uncharacterized protein n=1 Tax=Gallus gallus TaxID=9031 RepID=A0A8V0YH00_CHICK